MRGSVTLLSAVLVVWVAGTSPRAFAQAAPPADHRVTIAVPAPVAVGQGGAISVTVAAEPGYTISRDGPLRIAVTAPTGLVMAKRRYARADAADARADDPRFDLRFKVEAVGEHTVAMTLRFWVCAARSCRPVSLERTVLVRGIAAQPAPTPAPSP
jgi:hypothetical protein